MHGFLKPDDYKQDEEIYEDGDVIGVSLSNHCTYEVKPGTFHEKAMPIPPERHGQQPQMVQMFFFEDNFTGNRVVGMANSIVAMELTPRP